MKKKLYNMFCSNVYAYIASEIQSVAGFNIFLKFGKHCFWFYV